MLFSSFRAIRGIQLVRFLTLGSFSFFWRGKQKATVKVARGAAREKAGRVRARRGPAAHVLARAPPPPVVPRRPRGAVGSGTQCRRPAPPGQQRCRYSGEAGQAGPHGDPARLRRPPHPRLGGPPHAPRRAPRPPPLTRVRDRPGGEGARLRPGPRGCPRLGQGGHGPWGGGETRAAGPAGDRKVTGGEEPLPGLRAAATSRRGRGEPSLPSRDVRPPPGPRAPDPPGAAPPQHYGPATGPPKAGEHISEGVVFLKIT